MPVCPSVLLRSEPAAIRFKAAIAPGGGRSPPFIAEQICRVFASAIALACPQIGSACPGWPGP